MEFYLRSQTRCHFLQSSEHTAATPLAETLPWATSSYCSFLFHLSQTDQPEALAAVTVPVPSVRKQGFNFATVSKLLPCRGCSSVLISIGPAKQSIMHTGGSNHTHILNRKTAKTTGWVGICTIFLSTNKAFLCQRQLPTQGSLTNCCNPPSPSSRADSSGFLKQTLAAKILSSCAKVSIVLAFPNPIASLSAGGCISNDTSSNLATKSCQVSLNIII